MVWGGEALGASCLTRQEDLLVWLWFGAPSPSKKWLFKACVDPVYLHAHYYKENNMEASLGAFQSRASTKLTLLNCNLIWILEIDSFDSDCMKHYKLKF